VAGLRALILILVLAALAIAAVPVLVLINLLGGGTGWGLCQGGLTSCPQRFTSGPAMAMFLTLSLLAVVALIRIVTHLLRRIRQ
jgi:hypothetical protein